MFKDETHEKIYAQYLERIGWVNEGSAEYRTAIYLLSAAHPSYQEFVNKEGINFRGIFKSERYAVAGSGKRKIVQLAGHLFNQICCCKIVDRSPTCRKPQGFNPCGKAGLFSWL